MEITTIGLDLAKNVFQVYGINCLGEVIVRKTLRRAQMIQYFTRLDPCLVGIEACGTSHYRSRPSVVLDRTNNARDIAFDASKFRLTACETQAHRRT